MAARVLLLRFSLAIFILSAGVARAQEGELDVKDIEAYLQEEQSKEEQSKQDQLAAPAPSPTPMPVDEEVAEPSDSSAKKKPAKAKSFHQLSDLAELVPFKDIAVLQKKYFPKTERYEFELGITGLLNDSFFWNVGGVARLGYYFSESWGIGASVFLLSESDKRVTEDLAERGIATANIVTPEMYYGLDLKWVPVYGKLAHHDESIVHFDLYFSAGLGMTQTTLGAQASSEPTLHLGAGQGFALSRSTLLHWDFSWHWFSPEPAAGAASGNSGAVSNFFLTVGMSFFFPEASYR